MRAFPPAAMRVLPLLVAAGLAAGVAAGSVRADGTVPSLPPNAELAAARQQFLQLAESGVARAKSLWWDDQLGWYDERLHSQWHQPLLMLWSAYELFNALNGIALADPSPANVQAVRDFADGAEAYWNPAVRPVGAYGYYPQLTDTSLPYYFDDNGWFGLAFLDAYGITHDRRYLVDAIRAFRFLAAAGWDARNGGFWWETTHDHKTSEPLASAILIGVRLYEATHKRSYLNKALRWLGWANARSWNGSSGLYQRSETDGTVMSYVEGLMAAANRELCAVLHRQNYCDLAELVARDSLVAFGVDLDWAPQPDAVYLYGLLNLYARDGDATWYALAYHNALRAAATQDTNGLYLVGWNGRPLGEDTRLGDLGTDAATLSVFAWLAASPLPGTSS